MELEHDEKTPSARNAACAVRAWLRCAMIALLCGACATSDAKKTDQSPLTGGPIGSGGVGAAPSTGSGVMPMAHGSGGMQAPSNGNMQPAGGGNIPPPTGSGHMPTTGGGNLPMMDAATSNDADASTVQPGPGGFPRGDDVNTDQMGPYAFESYSDGLDDPIYASSIMYYPTDATPPFAAVVFSPGFSATKEQYMDFLGPLLASHGIAILLTTPTTTADLPTQRAEDLEAAVAHITTENERSGSPLQGKLATDRVCVTGHSMGGGGTLWAATDLGAMIRCAVPLQPWQPGQSFDQIKAPTMFIAAQSDSVADVASNAHFFFDSMPATATKYYVEFAGASHFLTTNDLGQAYDVQSKYMIAFYKVYLEDDMRYMDVLHAPMDAALSTYIPAM
jgi:dienelactone hydrolase